MTTEMFLCNRYRVIGKLGDGGMGEVFEAEDAVLQRRVAIKALALEYCQRRDVLQRFCNEARASSNIRHPGIIDIYDLQEEKGRMLIIMELLHGEDLHTRLRREGRIPLDQSVRLCGQMASALHAAHQRGIVHRDLKPANVFIVSDPQVVGGERIKILDFGIAKIPQPDDEDADYRTRADAVLGTPRYMAPEQSLGSANVDARADLYALGCILFHMLCGRPPFTESTAVSILLAHRKKPPPRPSALRPDIGESLDRLVLSLLSKDPAQRPQSASHLEEALLMIMDSGSATVTLPVSHGSEHGSEPEPTTLTSAMGHRVLPQGPNPPPTRRRGAYLAGVVGALLIASLLAILLWRDERNPVVTPEHEEPVQPDAGMPDAPAPPLACQPDQLHFEPCQAPCVFLGEDGTKAHTLATRPEGANVWFAGADHGPTPLQITHHADLECTASFRVNKQEHADEIVSFHTARNQDLLVELMELVPIDIRSRPRRAEVYDATTGQVLGRTPTRIWLPRSDQPYTLILRKSGYDDARLEVRPGEGDSSRRVKLEKSRRQKDE